ncbi:hypothetical protein C2W62_38870 [Candidatus Entotheonella serta]|nr:hypothetical protein C2W62_38870 [Candidatus Entotheonella serta]
MDQSGLLDLVKAYVKEQKPEIELDSLAQTPIRDVLIDSLDITEFLMEMEDRIGLESEAIDLDELGPKLAENPTFAELADDIIRYLDDHNIAH